MTLVSCFTSLTLLLVVVIHFTYLWLVIDSLKSVRPWPAGCRILIYVVDLCVACFLFGCLFDVVIHCYC